MRKLRTLMVIGASLIICGGACAASAEAVVETATLQTSFTPDRLGASTTIGFGFHLSTTEGLAPPPLTSIDLHMPAGMNYTATTLGLAICEPKALEEHGLSGCPADSRLGSGSAYVEVPFGTGAGQELPTIQALMGPPTKKSNLVVLFYANGQTPVFAQLVFRGELLSQTGVFGSSLNTLVPPIPSVPNGPDVSILSVASTIGPDHLVYTKHEHGRLIHFEPVGIAVPEKCPHGGFPFMAEFGFQDGSHASASSTVPCPPARHKHR
jgi:hypothetical protein